MNDQSLSPLELANSEGALSPATLRQMAEMSSDPLMGQQLTAPPTSSPPMSAGSDYIPLRIVLMHVGANINMLMVRKRILPEDFANSLGIDPNRVEKMLIGTEHDLDFLMQSAAKLGGTLKVTFAFGPPQ